MILTVYIFSYLVVRQTYQEVWEKDKQTYLLFPENKILYYLYRPLVYIDGKLTAMQFHIGQH